MIPWEANCERLDYTPAQKVEIRAKVLAASGELVAAKEAAKAAADAARAEAAKRTAVKKPRAADGSFQVRAHGERAPGAAPKQGKNKGRSAAAVALAEDTGVSPSTAEFVVTAGVSTYTKRQAPT